MSLNELPTIHPDEGAVETAELVVDEAVLVKLFALGPGASVDPHEHAESVNVFHILEGRVVVMQGDTTETISAPGVVHNDRGIIHGARNDSSHRALLTASLCPLP
ncbi:MAG: cupin domain-containing protein [Natronomonas sp.]